MQKTTSIINNEQGTVIIMAMIVLVMLTIIGISATSTSTTEVQISTNAVLHNIAFYTADSGIEVGRAVLNNIKLADSGNWDNLLFNASDPPPAVPRVITWNGVDCTTLDEIIDAEGGRTVGPTAFTLTIEDNNDLDGDPLVDSDDTVILTSQLVAPYRNATATILTTVHGGGVAYSQEHYDAGSTGEAALESESVSSNVRW
ncbi:hypothetical protein JY97_07655 [Alkalispirochaeta odontotermitis]|nr:hypothetical protein JY97_07655 [Alkalispirochaeta odontotermitis]CAB1075919.1 hypothetical protein D1AOALGA4SA_3723 [Olavius algarvensis Delta 1 endosymbiont]